jgi:hypothetical protein
VSEEDIRDPRVAPRWLEVGITGVPRTREWDAVTTVDVPELEGDPASELAFTVLADGTIALRSGETAPLAAAERLAGAVFEVDRPCDILAVRRGVREWSVAGRRRDMDAVSLPDVPGAAEIAVAVGPDGARTVLVDGEEADDAPEVAQAADELERRGRERHRAFVARASRTAAGWTLTIDPL